MKYPIGIQSFEDLRISGYVYVDKTALAYSLTHDYKYVFLGRPRRFGKSLLMSTIQAYFEGRKDLFAGLAIEKLESDWAKHPVLHFDLNNGNYSSVDGLINILHNQLSDYEHIYGKNPNSNEPQFRLQWLIKQAYQQTGSKVVLLVDEYDKPILQAIGNESLDKAVRDILKPFYGTLKSEDAHIRFAMLTGVSKFGQLSVFSDLNNIEDISLDKNYADICGLTESEILHTFQKEIQEFAIERKVSIDIMMEELRAKYDGYRFSKAQNLVYNPFSLLNSLKKRELGDYWFVSGTPTALVKLLQHNNYDLSEVDGERIRGDLLYEVNNLSPIPILYQCGYLTIKDYDPARNLYTLGYPNQEVESGFLNFLLPFYSNVPTAKSDTEIFNLVDEINNGEVDEFMTRLQSIFYSIPYAHDNSMKVQEDQFRNLVYLVFKLMGLHIHVECQMSKGRSDAVVWTNNHIYIIEFKVDSTPEIAMRQIHDKEYSKPFASDHRDVILIGVNYSTSARAITSWVVDKI